MASPNTIIFLRVLFSYVLFSSMEGYAYAARETEEELSQNLKHSYRIEVNSLLPSTVCNPSPKGEDKEATILQVVHRHGPCSQLQPHKAHTPTHTQILSQDQARVDSIHSRLSKKVDASPLKQSAAATLPAHDGRSIGSGNYIVTVGLGTPKRQLSLIFDTGSDLAWTQCEPCARSCYAQKEATFDPSKSTSYTNVSCNAVSCNELIYSTGNAPGCAASTCVYGIAYGDSSFSVGFLGEEILTLSPTDTFNKFLFGCGQNNQGLFGGSAGLLGLGRGKLSIVEQMAQKYGKIFSYCLPSSSSFTGRLAFGKTATTNAIKYTPLSTASLGSSFYGIDITAISVGGKKLSISASAFSSAGAIIDSGTVITRLPPAAYDALKSAFKQLMSKYPTAPALSILDTCYDLSKFKRVVMPKIVFLFGGGVAVELDAKGILYVNGLTQVCLAFAANSGASDVAIFGNAQQKTLEVVYDAAAGRVGFGPKGCA